MLFKGETMVLIRGCRHLQKLSWVRNVSTTDDNDKQLKVTHKSEGPQSESFLRDVNKVRPDKWHRHVLLKAKMYSSQEEIPERVSIAKIQQAKDKYRVRITVYSGIVLIVGMIIAGYTGKVRLSQGYSLQQNYLDNVKRLQSEGKTNR